jgi:hypothetical protein
MNQQCIVFTAVLLWKWNARIVGMLDYDNNTTREGAQNRTAQRGWKEYRKMSFFILLKKLFIYI